RDESANRQKALGKPGDAGIKVTGMDAQAAGRRFGALPWVGAAHRRVRGLGSPYRAELAWWMEELWVEE
ncbi:MAG: hypothetical protein ACREK5_09150, partial [Gemmatimonadota bacterium]